MGSGAWRTTPASCTDISIDVNIGWLLQRQRQRAAKFAHDVEYFAQGPQHSGAVHVFADVHVLGAAVVQCPAKDTGGVGVGRGGVGCLELQVPCTRVLDEWSALAGFRSRRVGGSTAAGKKVT
jgi:hypothetical protein